MRVLKWIVERLEQRAEASDTAIGRVPAPDALDVSGMGPVADAILTVDPVIWRREAEANAAALARLGYVPEAVLAEQAHLEERLAEVAVV